MKRDLTALASLLAFTTALPVASAAEYYASPSGNGDGSSESSPMSLSSAVSKAGAGDTVLLLGGEYSGVYTVNNSGNSGAWLTFKAAPGALPIIKGSGGGDQSGFGVKGTYVRVEGIVSRGFASGFSNSWGGPNGNIEFKYCVADDHGRNGIAFYSAANVLVEGCIVSHVGYSQGWSSGINMYGATGTSIVRRNLSFENIDASGNRTDGSGFIADESSRDVVFENNIGFRNGGSCIRLTKSSGCKLINNTCIHNGLDSGVQYHDEIFFSDATSRSGAVLRNNLCIPTSGQVGLKMGDGVTNENNIWDGQDSLVVSGTGNLDFHLASGASTAIDMGSSTGAPSVDIGFDWKCIRQQANSRYDWWQYSVDYDYVGQIGGVSACFNAGARSGAPDIGAYEAGSTPANNDNTGGAPTAETGGAPTAETGGAPAATGGVSFGPATGGTPSTGGTVTAPGTGGDPITNTSAGGTGGLPAQTGGATGGIIPTDNGSCPVGRTACGTMCVDLTSDINNCGACSSVCATGQQCLAGTCTTVSRCQEPLVECGGACVDKMTDPLSCGACGAGCQAGQVCSGGVCSSVCAAGLTQCGLACVDLTSNLLNCGACQRTCAAGQTCQAGQCDGTATGGDPTVPATPPPASEPAQPAAGAVVANPAGCGCSVVGAGRSRFAALLASLVGLMMLRRQRRRTAN